MIKKLVTVDEKVENINWDIVNLIFFPPQQCGTMN